MRHFNIELGDYSIALSWFKTGSTKYKLAFEDSFEAIESKRNSLMLRIQQLQNETTELERKLAEMQPGKK